MRDACVATLACSLDATNIRGSDSVACLASGIRSIYLILILSLLHCEQQRISKLGKFSALHAQRKPTQDDKLGKKSPLFPSLGEKNPPCSA
jgi:hypothetical protein